MDKFNSLSHLKGPLGKFCFDYQGTEGRGDMWRKMGFQGLKKNTGFHQTQSSFTDWFMVLFINSIDSKGSQMNCHPCSSIWYTGNQRKKVLKIKILKNLVCVNFNLYSAWSMCVALSPPLLFSFISPLPFVHVTSEQVSSSAGTRQLDNRRLVEYYIFWPIFFNGIWLYGTQNTFHLIIGGLKNTFLMHLTPLLGAIWPFCDRAAAAVRRSWEFLQLNENDFSGVKSISEHIES